MLVVMLRGNRGSPRPLPSEAPREQYATAASMLWVLGGGNEIMRPGAGCVIDADNGSAASRHAAGGDASGDSSLVNAALVRDMLTEEPDAIVVAAGDSHVLVLYEASRVPALVERYTLHTAHKPLF